MISKAIKSINPNAVFIVGRESLDEITWLEGTKPIDKPTIEAKLKELEDEYEKQAYARSRAESYDPIPEQLDQIYHDMDGWKAKVKAVKDKYPKPSE